MSPTAELALDAGILARIFPWYVAVDASGDIQAHGPSLPKLVDVRVGSGFDDLFHIARPPKVGSIVDVFDELDSLYVLETEHSDVRFRGQFIETGACLVFLGSPWLTESAALGRLGLRQRDFALHDPAFDLLNVMQAQSMALQDTKRLTTRLKEQREDLRSARDAAEAAAETKSRFLANMSHEIRTPLNGVLGMLNLLEGTDPTPEQNHLIQTAIGAGKSLQGIIDDVLDLSKIEAGKMRFEREPFDVRTLFEELTALLSERALDSGVRLTTIVDPGVSAVVSGDAHRLKQVVMNLTSNALKFTEQGSVQLRVRRGWTAENLPDGDGILRVEVQDTGIGIARDRLDALFQPFEQADGSTTRRFGGTGLGLTISKRLVEGMDGRIGAASTPGEGSTFWFEIRVGDGQERVRPSEKRLVGAPVALHLPPEFGEMVESQLTDEGIRVVPAGNPEAVAQIRFEDEVSEALDSEGAPHLPTICAYRRDRPQGVVPGPGLATVRIPAPRSALVRAISEALALRPSPAPSPQDDGSRRNTRNVRRSRILLVEDNEVNRMVALGQLGPRGHEVEVARNGEEAVARWADGEWDLVLMDCQMPVMDGFEATGRIRAAEERDETEKRVPIVAMTANAMPGDRERCLASGMDDYVSKPLDPARLDDLLREWLPSAGAGTEGPPPGAEGFVVGVLGEQETLNATFLDQLIGALGDDGAGLAEMIARFAKDVPRILDVLRSAQAADDVATLYMKSHGLKGAAQSLGANALGEATEFIEDAAREGRPVRAECIDRLAPVIEATMESFARLLPALDPTAPPLRWRQTEKDPALDGSQKGRSSSGSVRSDGAEVGHGSFDGAGAAGPPPA